MTTIKSDLTSAQTQQLFKPLEKRKGNKRFYKAIFIYMIGGLVGTVWETLLNLVNGYGFVFCNGSLFTPFNFVYGVGGLVIIGCLHNRTKWWEIYSIGMLGGGAVEYVLSFLEEKLLGTRSWNYEGMFLNINGRTTIVYMAFWGLLCVVVICLVYKPLNRCLEALPTAVLKTVAIVMAVVIVLDLVITVCAIARYAGRNADLEAVTGLGRLIDSFFNDEFMRRRFPNMHFNKG